MILPWTLLSDLTPKKSIILNCSKYNFEKNVCNSIHLKSRCIYVDSEGVSWYTIHYVRQPEKWLHKDAAGCLNKMNMEAEYKISPTWLVYLIKWIAFSWEGIKSHLQPNLICNIFKETPFFNSTQSHTFQPNNKSKKKACTSPWWAFPATLTRVFILSNGRNCLWIVFMVLNQPFMVPQLDTTGLIPICWRP